MAGEVVLGRAGHRICTLRIRSRPAAQSAEVEREAILIGPVGLHLVDLGNDAAPITMLLEAALVLVLFTDAMAVRRTDLAVGGFLPGRRRSSTLTRRSQPARIVPPASAAKPRAPADSRSRRLICRISSWLAAGSLTGSITLAPADLSAAIDSASTRFG